MASGGLWVTRDSMALLTADAVRRFLSMVVHEEPFGTGNGTETVFFLKLEQEELYKKGHAIVNGSEQIYVNGVLKTKTTDYTIDNENGKVTFVAAPANLATLKANFRYTLFRHLSDTELTILINDAEMVIEGSTGYKWEETTVTGELYNEPNIPRRGRFGYRSLSTNVLELRNWPVTTLTALTVDGISITTSKVYLQPPELPRWLELADTAERTTFSCQNPQGISVSYKYGFNSSSTNPCIKEPALRAVELCKILTLLLCAGINIYALSLSGNALIQFGSFSIDRTTYLSAGEEQLRRWIKNAETITRALPIKMGVG